MIDNEPSRHYPGKEEAKLLRKLKLQTLTIEEEIRSHKKYRKMLADSIVLGNNKGKSYEVKYNHHL